MTFKYHDFSFHFRFSALESRRAEISQQLNHVHALCPGTGKYSRHCRPCPQKNTEENKIYRTVSTLNCPFRFIRFSIFLYDLVCTTRYCFLSLLFLLIKSVHFLHRQRYRKISTGGSYAIHGKSSSPLNSNSALHTR